MAASASSTGSGGPPESPAPTARQVQLQALLQRPWRAIRLAWSPEMAVLRVALRVRPIPCFSLLAMDELQTVLDTIDAVRPTVRHFVVSSDIPKVFNFGGDLSLFVLLARARDAESLRLYGRKCIDLIWWMECADEREVLTTGLVQGDMLGGGLESVLPMHRVICERSVNAGFPEVLFNLFPGMGAWNFVARRTSLALANEMVLSGRLYSAEELRQHGLIDEVVNDGEGEAALEQSLRAVDARWRGTLNALRARRVAAPIARSVLDTIVDQWADSALGLTDRDLRLMERLARAQLRKVGGAEEGAIEEIKRIELEQAWAAMRPVLGPVASGGTLPATPV